MRAERRRLRGLAVVVLTASGGCGNGKPANDSGAGPVERDAAPFDAAVPPATDSGTCVPVVSSRPIEGATHLETCSPVSYESNPASSGNHYGTWAAHGAYEFALPRGFWVHNLEHGAVVITYNCPEGCARELDEARRWLDALAVDAACLGTVASPRAILAPDPLLDVPWAASAWGWTLRASCFDPEGFDAFYAAHVGQGLEDICTPGTDFRGPDGQPIAALPAGCLPN